MRDTLNLVGGDNPGRALWVRQKQERAQARIYGDSAHVGKLKKEAIQKVQDEKHGFKANNGKKGVEKIRERAKMIDAEAQRKKQIKDGVAKEREEMQQARFKYEDENLGGYFRAFPAADGRYDEFVTATPSLSQETKSMRMRREANRAVRQRHEDSQ